MKADMSDMKAILAGVAAGHRLSEDEAELAFDIIMSGNATPSQMGGFLMALRVRGETVDEIAGAVAAMRAKMTKVEAPDVAIGGGSAVGGPRGEARDGLLELGYPLPEAESLLAAAEGDTVEELIASALKLARR